MTEQERQMAERAAIVNAMGNIFGQLRRIDNDMVEHSSTLSPTAHKTEAALRSYLRSQQPTVIPPAPQEVLAAGAGAMPPQLPQTQAYTGTPIEHLAPNISTPIDVGPLTPTPTYVPPSYYPQPAPTDNLVEISRKLDTIIGQLQQLIMVLSPQTWSVSTKDIPLYEDTSKSGEAFELPGSDPESK